MIAAASGAVKSAGQSLFHGNRSQESTRPPPGDRHADHAVPQCRGIDMSPLTHRDEVNDLIVAHLHANTVERWSAGAPRIA